MDLPSIAEPVSDAAAGRWTSVVEHLDRCLVCLDFDGTLSRIVDDPSDARIHPDGPDVLAPPPAAAGFLRRNRSPAVSIT